MAPATPLKIERLKKGILQKVIADDLGLSVPSYCKIETGRRKPRKLERERLVQLLGLKVEQTWL